MKPIAKDEAAYLFTRAALAISSLATCVGHLQDVQKSYYSGFADAMIEVLTRNKRMDYTRLGVETIFRQLAEKHADDTHVVEYTKFFNLPADVVHAIDKYLVIEE